MNIVITGKNSYIGQNIRERLTRDGHTVVLINVRNDEWKKLDFTNVNVLIHCAALVHKNEKEFSLDDYRKINVELTNELAHKAKAEGVRQFVFMSSRAVYGQENSCWHEVVVNEKTILKPKTKYGITKLEAEKKLMALENEKFLVAILRFPFIYGKGCKGNYQKLRKYTLLLPLLPNYKNEYSMLYIDNLCELVSFIVRDRKRGLFMPQNKPLNSTYDMMKLIKKYNDQKVVSTRIFNPFIRILSIVCRTIRNAFGNAIYDLKYSNCGYNYNVVEFEKSIQMTEEK